MIGKTALPLITQRIPTLGASAVVMALQLCDQVSLAGFGYDMQHPRTRLHYYETLHMSAMKAQVFGLLIVVYICFESLKSLAPLLYQSFLVTQVTHDISAEKHFLRDLVAAGAVTDLTGAL